MINKLTVTFDGEELPILETALTFYGDYLTELAATAPPIPRELTLINQDTYTQILLRAAEGIYAKRNRIKQLLEQSLS